ncbi:cation-transporting P-type ATPase [Mycobacterium genavense]|uniref:cation-transporting P-type ATPase n=1 Tax=Mycobacterium genavense TaxID=36812 RepID=UPI001FE201CE|nr:cation-transporting P-type ATPase [Mycobacterium genavense]
MTAHEAARRLVALGPNDVGHVPPQPKWKKIVSQFRSPLVYLLLAALVASLGVWAIEGASEWPVDAVVIGAILVLNAVLGYGQEATRSTP